MGPNGISLQIGNANENICIHDKIDVIGDTVSTAANDTCVDINDDKTLSNVGST